LFPDRSERRHLDVTSDEYPKKWFPAVAEALATVTIDNENATGVTLTEENVAPENGESAEVGGMRHQNADLGRAERTVTKLVTLRHFGMVKAE
jgi:hypothetical protein